MITSGSRHGRGIVIGKDAPFLSVIHVDRVMMDRRRISLSLDCLSPLQPRQVQLTSFQWERDILYYAIIFEWEFW
jgi:hypothetical protein